MTGQLFQTPGSFVPLSSFRYADSANPILSWSPASELWGSPLYGVRVDGVQVASTGATSIRSPLPLANGRHSWQVTAVNKAGLSTVAKVGTVFVDTVKPRVSFKLSGTRVVGATVRISVSVNDAPAPLRKSQSSGIKTVQVKWGDGAKPFIRNDRASHVYKRRRTYTVTVIVKDRAGNRTVVTRKVKISPTGGSGKKSKSKPKSKSKVDRPPAVGLCPGAEPGVNEGRQVSGGRRQLRAGRAVSARRRRSAAAAGRSAAPPATPRTPPSGCAWVRRGSTVRRRRRRSRYGDR